MFLKSFLSKKFKISPTKPYKKVDYGGSSTEQESSTSSVSNNSYKKKFVDNEDDDDLAAADQQQNPRDSLVGSWKKETTSKKSEETKPETAQENDEVNSRRTSEFSLPSFSSRTSNLSIKQEEENLLEKYFIGLHQDIDSLIKALNGIQGFIDKTLLYNNNSKEKRKTTIKFIPFDTSIVPPPDVRFPGSIYSVEDLLRRLLDLRKAYIQLKKNETARRLCCENEAIINSNLLNSSEKFMFDLIRKATTSPISSKESPFDEEIINRFSSIIRYHLRLALNRSQNFAPIVLSNQNQSGHKITNLDLVIDLYGDLNVASIFHQALIIVKETEENEDENNNDYLSDNCLEFQSARKFIMTVLDCAKRIERVDTQRKLSWQAAQNWARVLRDAFSSMVLEELVLLSDLEKLRRIIQEQDLDARVMIARHQKISKNESTLRLKRLAATPKKGTTTTLLERKDPFPSIAFILDA